MALRDTLLANLSVALANSSVTSTSELPFTAAGVALYDKNMKKLYVDYDRTAFTEMFNTLNPASDVPQREITVNAYFTLDAKNLPSDVDTVVNTVFNSRLSVSNCHVCDCSMTNLMAEDRLTYTFEFRFLTI